MQENVCAWKEAMRPINYHVMFEIEEENWWFVGRRKIILAQVENIFKTYPVSPEKRKILDVGCGTGATLDRLTKYGRTYGTDLEDIPLRYTFSRGHNQLLSSSLTALPYSSNTFDLITAIDVIEHIDDDVQSLKEIYRVLKPGGHVVINVPAFMALWGPNDVQVGHKRRYRIPQLKAALEQAGFQISKISYNNCAMFVPIWVGRKLLALLKFDETVENQMKNSSPLNKILTGVYGNEANWLIDHSLPFGSSIICVGSKEAGM